MFRYIWLSGLINFYITGLLLGQDTTKISQLEERISILEDKIEKSELNKLIKEAEQVVSEQGEQKESKIFRGGQRSLQALNPEISMAADLFGQLILNEDYFTEEGRSGGHFRVVETQIQSNLDPYSQAKIILEFSPAGVEFAEAYINWSRILPNISLTAGKFRQQFGVVNRWHAHALDQFEFPLPLTTLLGEEGINQIGISLHWLMPSFIAHSNSLYLQITNGQNNHLFAGETFSYPAILSRLTNYYDLSENTYLEFGATGMIGKNNIRGYVEGEKNLESRRYTTLAGLDLTISWEPVDKAKYKSFLWRTEAFYVDKELVLNENIRAFGAYSYLEYKFHRKWQAGVRVGYTQPFEIENSDHNLYQYVPYLTRWQSPWVRWRLQYNYLDGTGFEKPDQQLRLQITWAMGPHKHDRY